MTLIDTHCHLDDTQFDADRDAVVSRARSAGLVEIVVPATKLATIEATLACARRYGFHAACGVHPGAIPADVSPETAVSRLTEQLAAAGDGVVAIGEIGLDYHGATASRQSQRAWLEAQLGLAAEHRLPVILHDRDATDDLLSILTAWVSGGLPAELIGRRGVLHAFAGSPAVAERALAAGFLLGIGGLLTFKNAGLDELRAAARAVPGTELVLETDAPVLAPDPHRGTRNEPAYVGVTAAALAALRDTTVAAVAALTTANARRLFAPPAPQ